MTKLLAGRRVLVVELHVPAIGLFQMLGDVVDPHAAAEILFPIARDPAVVEIILVGDVFRMAAGRTRDVIEQRR